MEKTIINVEDVRFLYAVLLFAGMFTAALSSSRKKFSIANFSFLTLNKGCFD